MKQVPIPLDCFSHRYTLRHPVLDDIDALMQLEQACWPTRQCIQRPELYKRLSRSSIDHLVLSIDEKIVGAIYSQPISDISRFKGHSFETVSELYDKEGNVIHLLAVNVLPSMQYLGFGDQLLEFMLLYSSIREGVNHIVAVSRCKDYAFHTQVPYTTYIHQRNSRGLLVDPILRFHDQHGGCIDSVIPNYRPYDGDNQGNGVLVVYETANQTLDQLTPHPETGIKPLETYDQLVDIVTDAVQFVLSSKKIAHADPKVPLHDLGMDSLDLFGLRLILSRKLDYALSPTFFFQHCTVDAIISYFSGVFFGKHACQCPSVPISIGSERISKDRGDERLTCPPPIDAMIRKPTVSESKNMPLAVVGMACRLPQAQNIDEFWSLLTNGRDAITPIPADRWPESFNNYTDKAQDGKINSPFGGFLSDIAEFDASFFKISPREARRIDPQQRLLLELHHEALEYSGIAPDSLFDTETGFFVGAFAFDYERLFIRSTPWEDYDLYFGTGNSAAMAAGRLAYTFGCHGPALTLNTACSSSLVAIHLACQSLREGQCNLALASGVNLLLSPELSISFSKAGMLSQNGRCKAFDASADGYVRSEGGGVLVLKRLEDAIADNNTVHALIRGSAVNQDGNSNGLTAPNVEAQVSLLQTALAQSGVRPQDIAYIEAHGTGTSLGDPVEFEALSHVFGCNRNPAEPLIVGSVKTNIGHTEAAAGISGLIKVILSLKHRTIPQHLHFKRPNPYIDLQRIPAEIPVKTTPWKRHAQKTPLRAGVSAFGFSGTNAHVIIEEWQPATPSATKPIANKDSHILTLSATHHTALSQLAADFETFLSRHPNTSLQDLCYTTHLGRSHYRHRLAVIAHNMAELKETLQTLNANPELSPHRPSTIFQGSNQQPQIAFAFTGQGSQYFGMAQDLYQNRPVFRKALDRCADILSDHLTQPLLSVIYPQGQPTASADSLLNQTAFTQPALFAVEYALAQLWLAYGICPEYVLGHSVGEYVASCIAGVFKLEDALSLIAARGRLMQALPPGGGMAAVFSDLATVQQAIAEISAPVDVAAINGPQNIVVSGLTKELQRLLALLSQRSIQGLPLMVSHAFHSALMEPMLSEFESIARRIDYSPPTLKIVSNVTGEIADKAIATADYWVSHIRRPVQFAQSMALLSRIGIDALLEVGPKPILVGMAKACLNDAVADKTPPLLLTSLRPGQEDLQTLNLSIGALYGLGCHINWAVFHEGQPGRRIPLPTYRFQRQSYWLPETRYSQSSQAVSESSDHPLLGRRLSSPLKETVFTATISADQFPWINNHRLGDHIVFPGAAYLDMAFSAAQKLLLTDNVQVQEVMITQAMIFPDQAHAPLKLQTIFTPSENAGYTMAVYSQTESATVPTDWQRHATAVIAKSPAIDNTHATCPTVVDIDHIHKTCSLTADIHCGGISHIHHNKSQALAKVLSLSTPNASPMAASNGLPAELIDTCLHIAAKSLAVLHPPAERTTANSQNDFVILGIKAVRVFSSSPQSDLWCHIQINESQSPPHHVQTPLPITADLNLYDASGQTVLTAEEILFHPLMPHTLGGKEASAFNDLYYVAFEAMDADEITATSLLPEVIKQKVIANRSSTVPVNSKRIASTDQKTQLQLLESISVSYIEQAFKALGWPFKPGDCLSVDQIRQQLNITERYHRLTHRMMEILGEKGITQRSNGHWKVMAPLPASDHPQPDTPTTIVLDPHPTCLKSHHPELEAELTLLASCGENLSQVLSGQCDPLQLLFPDADISNAERLYDDSLAFGPMNQMVRKTVKAIVETAAATNGHRPLRILEIGAGTGGTTAHILPDLQNAAVEYIFSDVSQLFTRKASLRFNDFPFVQYRQLNIENEPLSQGFQAGEIDLIIAANVFHATTDLEQTLTHSAQLLGPTGLLLLLEGVEPRKWIDLIFGLIEGWWRFQDTHLRAAYPLISTEKWKQLLNECGFQQPVSISPPVGQHALFNQSIVLARKAPRKDIVDAPLTTKHFLILADQNDACTRFATALKAQGHRSTLIYSRPVKKSNNRKEVVAPDDRIGFERILDQHPDITHIIQLWGLDLPAHDQLDEPAFHQAVNLTCQATLTLLQAIFNKRPTNAPHLSLIVKGAQALTVADHINPLATPLWALADVIQQEHPELNCRCYDLPACPETGDIEFLIKVMVKSAASSPPPTRSAPKCMLRDGRLWVPKLRRTALKSAAEIQFDAQGTYIVTGGTGGLGLKITQWMATNGAGHIVLINRHPPNEQVRQWLATLPFSGTTITPLQGDVTCRNDMSRIFQKVTREMAPVKGIVHAAGVFDDSLLGNHTWEKFERVLAPKIFGSWHLHHLSQGCPLDFFILFSSAMTLLPNAGLGNYVAANAFMESLATYRNQLGLPAVSIAWGPWEDVGMAGQVGTARTAQWAAWGLKPIPVDQALTAMQGIIVAPNDHPSSPLGLMNIHWPTFTDYFQATPSQGWPTDFYTDLIQPADTCANPQKGNEHQPPSPPEISLVALLIREPSEKRKPVLTEHLRKLAAVVMAFASPEDLDPEEGFFQQGMDSLMAVELRSRIQHQLEGQLPSTVIFKYPNIHALVDYLVKNQLKDLLPLKIDAMNHFQRGKTHPPQQVPEGRISPLSEIDMNVSIEAELLELEKLLNQNE